MFCREHVVQLHQQIDKIHAAGAELVVVGSGKPHFVAGFRELTRYDGPIYCDPSLKSYEALGLHRSGWRMVNPKAALHAVRAMARGAFQGRTQGDALQQGGVAVIVGGPNGANGLNGTIVYQHTSETSGDNADPDEIVAALQKAVAAAA